MALSPVLPSDAKALVPDPNSTLCGNFLAALLKLPVLFYKLCAFLFTATGAPSKAAVNLTIKPGGYIDYASIQVEDGTILLCDGREVAQATYPDLFAALGTVYGTASDPVNNFKIPDWRARFPVGIGSFASAGSVVVGTPGGEDMHILTAGEIPTHSHTIHQGLVGHSPADNAVVKAASDGGAVDTKTVAYGGTGVDGVANGHKNIPPYLGMYRYIVC